MYRKNGKNLLHIFAKPERLRKAEAHSRRSMALPAGKFFYEHEKLEKNGYCSKRLAARLNKRRLSGNKEPPGLPGDLLQ